MKKIQILSLIALFIALGCSNDDMRNTEQDTAVFEEGKFSFIYNGEQQFKPNNGVSSITFYSNSVDENYVTNPFPTGFKLQKKGYFSGTIKGFGRIKSKLTTYEIISCDKLPINPPNIGEPDMYALVIQGILALGPRDYCDITITGNIYPWYYDQFGFYGGQFIGTAITNSGVGKLKGLDNKTFAVHNGYVNGQGPTINLETGTIALRISDFGQ